jgi:CubicO group peptidase (beta-lactamase class C family)
MLASISKSVTAVLAGILAEQSGIALNRLVHDYVEELKEFPIGGATLQHLMDMQAGIMLPVMTHRGHIGTQDGGLYEAMGLMPPLPGAPANLYEMVRMRAAGGPHGAQFRYDNAQTEALGWALRRATGLTGTELLSRALWRKLGMERDGFWAVDRLSSECFSGGIASTLRDLGRLGELIRCDGRSRGQQIIPAAFLDNLRRGSDRHQFSDSNSPRWLRGSSYKNSFHNLHDTPQADKVTIVSNGRFGQFLWIAPQSHLVIAALASFPGPPPSPADDRLAAFCQSLVPVFAC